MMGTCNIVDWLNFIVASVLALVIIFITFRLGRRQNQIIEEQNELQKRISADKNNLQKLLAEKDVKVALYEHRMNCYRQVMQALDVIVYSRIEDMIEVFNTRNVEHLLKKMSEGRNLLFKTHVESESLFDEEIVKYIGNLHHKYNKLYEIFGSVITISDSEFNKRRIQLLTSIGATSSDSNENILLKYFSFIKSEGSKAVIITIYPELKDYSTILEELRYVYQPKNALISLMNKYINMKDEESN